MTIEQVWKIVDGVHAASKGDMDTKCQLLGKELRKLTAEEVWSFAERFGDCDARAYTWELWAAAYIIGGGCSDDSFSDFRATLISMGQSTFERVVEFPEALIDLDLDEDNAFYEGYQYVAAEVYEEITGDEMPVQSKPHPKEPSGKEGKEDEVATIYPELAKKYQFDG
jgi:hypothetical protein